MPIDVVYIPALNSITPISCISKILASASLSASVNTTIYLCITRDMTGLGCSNIFILHLYSFSFFLFFVSIFLYAFGASFSWILNFIPFLTPLSPGTKITYRFTIFRTTFSHISVKYFNSVPVSIKTSPSLSSCFRSASCFIASLTIFKRL